MEKLNYVGTRWYKCDFHLHTPASKCFEQENVTASEWVEAAVEKGLDCVAVTDHNSGAWIDDIKDAAKDLNLTVFPGVELTCSDAKVHLLVLFDTKKSSQDIEDFLINLNLDRKVFGTEEAHCNLNLELIADKAKEKGALIIASHIDDFSSLSNSAYKTRIDFLKKEAVLGVQVVHQEFLLPDNVYNVKEIQDIIDRRYGKSIDPGAIKNWRATVQISMENNIPILTFSDNPIESGHAKHGLWGIGERYSWIKMDENPSLESLRQSLLLSNFRISNDFVCKRNEQPFITPELWIKSIEVFNTEITGDTSPLKIQFSPQMTTIIGGRGSGKSSILRFIRGLFESKINELDPLEDIKKDFSRFFQFQDKKGTGVLKPASRITIEFIRKGIQHQIEFIQENKNSKKMTIKRFNESTSKYDIIEDDSYLDFFEFDIFSQKQIYDISTKTNSLRKRIDDIVPDISAIKTELARREKSFIAKSSSIRQIEAEISGKGKLQTEIKDIEARIKTFNESGAGDLILTRQLFEKDTTILDIYRKNIGEFKEFLSDTFDEIEMPGFQLGDLQDDYKKEIEPIQKAADKKLTTIKDNIQSYIEEVQKIHDEFEEKIKKTIWYRDDIKSRGQLEIKKKDLAEKGISDLEIVEKEIKDVEEKKTELNRISKREEALAKQIEEKASLKEKYVEKRKELSLARKGFLDSILEGRNVSADVKSFRDFKNYEEQFRNIIGSETGFETAIKDLVTTLEKGEPVRNNQKIFDEISKLLKTDNSGIITDGFLQRKLKSLSGEQLDMLDLLFPEDEIVVKYKTKDSQKFKSISNASAGQKTAAILTLLLSHGKIPLILDQPEDDLDNHLIYELVVDQLRHSKEYRQIIVVTHNANIPVNGDSEYIVGMNSESENISILKEGAIENTEIRDEICDVMEGGTEAFEMRSKRYNLKK